jgi:phosphotransferase system IIB component
VSSGAGGLEWLAALGGAANVENLQQRSTRLILRLVDAAKLNQEALEKLGAHAVAKSPGGLVHVILDEATATRVAAALDPA